MSNCFIIFPTDSTHGPAIILLYDWPIQASEVFEDLEFSVRESSGIESVFVSRYSEDAVNPLEVVNILTDTCWGNTTSVINSGLHLKRTLRTDNVCSTMFSRGQDIHLHAIISLQT